MLMFASRGERAMAMAMAICGERFAQGGIDFAPTDGLTWT